MPVYGPPVDTKVTKAGFIINVHDAPYNAVGDGTTDDTAAWQAAVTAAGTTGTRATVTCKRGLTYLTQPIKVGSDIVIDLNGATIKPTVRVGGTNIWDAVFYTTGCTAANGCTGDGTTVVNRTTIKNGTIDTLGRTYCAVKAQNATRIHCINLELPSNQDKIGIRFDYDTDSCSAQYCHIISTVDSPFDTITNAQGISCYSNTGDTTGGAYGNYGTGTVNTITFNTPTNLSRGHFIAHNRIENGTHGVTMQGCDSITVDDNIITDTSHRAVIASVSKQCNISNNVATGMFSCAYLLCFGSHHNAVTGNTALCTTSVSELGAYRASFGSSYNLFSGNYAYGTTGPAYRTFTGSSNNTFVGNYAETCGTGLEFRSLNTDTGYPQNINTPAMVGNAAIGNTFVNCTYGITLRSGTTNTSGTTPATTGGISVPLTCTVSGNTIRSATTNGILIVEETAGTFNTSTGVYGCNGLANSISNTGAADVSFPRAGAHWASYQAVGGTGQAQIYRLPASGNSVEWRHPTTDVLSAFVTSAGGIATANRMAVGGNTIPTVSIAYINSISTTQIGLRVDGQSAQTADLQQWTLNASPSGTVTALARINKAGVFITAAHAAPADADLAAGDMAVWFDQTNGAGKLMVKAKTANGTVATGSVTLA